jgi:two-component system NtrC family sensor kinase
LPISPSMSEADGVAGVDARPASIGGSTCVSARRGLTVASFAAILQRVTSPAARRTTARRIVGAFSAVLLLFGLALLVMIVALDRIGSAERDVARLDRAKHAGHHAAAMAREQYMHQAHTLLTWDGSHLDHYGEIAEMARHATEHLRAEVAGHPGAEQAEEIARLVAESDRLFREDVWPAVARGERMRMQELHDMTDRPVQAVVDLNGRLNRGLENESEAARRSADRIRERARLVVIACFGMAIVLASLVGAYLMRSISRPVAALRAGAMRIGAGDLDARVGLPGDDELAELARVFDQMAANLARDQAELLEAHRLASIGQVASGVAHEINNPLGVILGYVMLLRKETELRDREELRIIEDEARQSKAIVAGLLDLARPVRLDRSEVDLAEIARDAASRLEESGQALGVAIRFREGSAARAVADEGKVRQIVNNLLSNAVEAARDVHAAAPEVEVSWCERNRRAWLQMDDKGPGIADDVRARLFEPFFTTRKGGHGLGLAIARTLARAHGGDIQLEPGPGGVGTRASLYIPLDVPSEAP